MPTYDYNDYNIDDDGENEISRRHAWELTSWILVALTLALNLGVILILLVRQNAYSVVNKGKHSEKCVEKTRQKTKATILKKASLGT